MKYYVFILLAGVIAVLGACEKAHKNGKECLEVGCRLEGESYYLVEQAKIFPQMDLCREQIEMAKDKFGVRILYKQGDSAGSELFISGGMDRDGAQYKFICEKRYYEAGFIYYFAKEETGTPN